jgi:hypothetical protein
MTRLKIWLTVLSIVCALPAVALAGAHNFMEVSLDVQGRWAQGAPASAYNSADGLQRMRCWLNGQVGQTTASGGCLATNAAGQTVSCFFNNNPAFAQAVSLFSSDTYVFFFYDTSGACQSIVVGGDSAFMPKR